MVGRQVGPVERAAVRERGVGHAEGIELVAERPVELDCRSACARRRSTVSRSASASSTDPAAPTSALGSRRIHRGSVGSNRPIPRSRYASPPAPRPHHLGPDPRGLWIRDSDQPSGRIPQRDSREDDRSQSDPPFLHLVSLKAHPAPKPGAEDLQPRFRNDGLDRDYEPSWVKLSSKSGTAPSTVTVSINTSATGVGVNGSRPQSLSGAIKVSATGATNTPLTVPVVLIHPVLLDGD